MKINKELKQWRDKGLLSEDEFLYLLIDQPRFPCFYSLPKIHKNLVNPTGRPIVSGVGGPTERLLQFVDIFLKPYVANLPSYIQDTKHILNLLTDVIWESRMTLVTMDVVALYTNIHHDLGLKAMRSFLHKRQIEYLDHTVMILSMTKLILENNVLLCNDI